jgi:hypothetical protein
MPGDRLFDVLLPRREVSGEEQRSNAGERRILR